mgnify:CR=1 FL=1
MRDGGAFYLLRASTAEEKVYVRTLSEPKRRSKDERRVQNLRYESKEIAAQLARLVSIKNSELIES